MPGIIIDTTLLIAAERGKFDLQAFFRAHSHARFSVSAVTIAELWHGVERIDPAFRASKEAKVRALLERITILDLTEEIALLYAKIWANLAREGKLIGTHDMMIAATCLHHGHAVATLNAKHFGMVRGLQLISV